MSPMTKGFSLTSSADFDLKIRYIQRSETTRAAYQLIFSFLSITTVQREMYKSKVINGNKQSFFSGLLRWTRVACSNNERCWKSSKVQNLRLWVFFCHMTHCVNFCQKSHFKHVRQKTDTLW
jgi:hypothetical protein